MSVAEPPLGEVRAPPAAASDEREWLQDQVAQYRALQPRYEAYEDVLERVLEAAAKKLAPLAIVQTRTKSISSFAEKAIRKRPQHADPVSQLTDLCGARVIVRIRSEADAVSAWVKEHFEIDWENSVDTADRLQPTEFGYRSVHYIVSLDPDRKLGVPVDEALHGLKAEVQVRTTVEHAWADFAHDSSYKGAFEPPVRWERELAAIAAQLEVVDRAFSQIEEGLRMYATSYGTYLSEEEIGQEIEALETVLEQDATNAQLAWRVGKLAMTLGDWKKAIDVMSPHVDRTDPDSTYQPLLRDLGISLCKRHRAEPDGKPYRRGRRYLERACEARGGDAESTAALAGTWSGIDEERAGALYQRAFELDPANYYALANFLEHELCRSGSSAIVAPLRPSVAAAIARCRAHAEVGINLPWAFYGAGRFHLLLGEPHDSLRAFARAVRASTAPFMVEGSLASLRKLGIVGAELEGYDWALRMLVLGLATKFPSPDATRQLSELASEHEPVEGPVVMVVGGTDKSVEAKMEEYRSLVLEAFRDFRGTIVCGGTRQGISGLVGDVAEHYSDCIDTLAYVPETLPPDAVIDERYELRRTPGSAFTPLQPLQSWIDLVASGVRPRDVKVLGINGGDVAAAEFRIALALGATVGVVHGSGREAGRLLADAAWKVPEKLLALPCEPQTARAFVGSGGSDLDSGERLAIGRAIHEAHRLEAAARLPVWDDLPDDLKESSQLQADHISEKLRQIGCRVRRVTDREIALMTFARDEVETLAEMEHGRWTAERLQSGWRWGPEKSLEKKISPYLVAWSDLGEEPREWDRATVRRIPQFLAEVGLEIYRDEVEELPLDRLSQPASR